MSNGLRTALRILTLMALGLSITAQADNEAPASAAAATGTYTVNPGDILEVSVWKEEDLQRQAIVRPDGFFSFPLTGDIRAEGQTIEAIRQEVASHVSRFIPDPVVHVSILEPRGSKVYVIGQVARPGEFPINRFVDVVQALSMAGGTTPFAQLDSIKILRRQGDNQMAIPFAYGDVAAGKRLQQNIVLKPGDTVLVP
jgi:polysaccharide export outer membrane protein